MRRQRSILQTFGHVKPAQSVFVQNKRGITGNCVESFRAWLRFVLRSFSFYEAGNVYACPFFRVPPHQFFPFAPRTSVRPCTGTVVNDSAIARPREAPTMPEIISGFSCVRLVAAIAAKDAGVNPAAGGSGAVSFQLRETIHLRAMMRFAVSIDAEHDAILQCGRGLSAPIVATLPHFPSLP